MQTKKSVLKTGEKIRTNHFSDFLKFCQTNQIHLVRLTQQITSSKRKGKITM